ncbi:MAG: bifunctional 5,10-methylenetetrahydrofolate dehydrogenase/5,10-methenyltetrahydrofolate cyclohydrolase [Dehalococcoidia bacterium]|nr:bifunctional 5,10-methylenetetrahydrofolate dehydrogenase/5,10-methenyltetrahydrofolate cyclohydrolase [Dehalococcoidia bacterium]MCA9851540.1 bifunctional 5,10-methylenetetrahydrofolate dehydrogenase/5,10-methenyltetrahydrofolate cyclohydrolase [Dehalococcoidia bacterium]MCB9483908.1 bifunctional 5,10-methylenetetrahydrofolate dehydrogenase/5,10-methenyltetrahydrofolate cyclohydrolase [Dehalococcoidia bacterium]MCB9491870.1 bifunctional 5,10-methylenetetrahydrofolate dehydrogenase/5,10-methe
MTARIIDGNAIADAVKADVAREVEALVGDGRPAPKLAVILVGDDPASHVYVRMKERDAQAVGMQSEAVRLPADTPHADVLAELHRLNNDPSVSGLFMQLPVPSQVDENEIIEAINPLKDVDGLTAASLGMLVQGKPVHTPATPTGVVEMLRREGIETKGAHVVIVGRSLLVGRPLSLLMSDRSVNATVTVAHTGTKDLGAVTREADILVAAMGVPKAITADMIRPGATVIDVGTTQVGTTAKGRAILSGDVDYEPALEVAGAITPVPGGVGPMTRAMLLVNTLNAAKRLAG